MEIISKPQETLEHFGLREKAGQAGEEAIKEFLDRIKTWCTGK
jgi:hypothetical protein